MIPGAATFPVSAELVDEVAEDACREERTSSLCGGLDQAACDASEADARPLDIGRPTTDRKDDSRWRI